MNIKRITIMKDENINISKDEKLAILLMESFDNPSDEAIALLDNEGCAQACKDLMDIEMALNTGSSVSGAVCVRISGACCRSSRCCSSVSS